MADYLDTEFYRNSFAHHLAYGEMHGASYLNPFPIMSDTFCDEIGVDNATGILNCSQVMPDTQ